MPAFWYHILSMKTKTKTKNARVFVSIIGLCTHVFLMKGQSGKSCEKKIHSRRDLDRRPPGRQDNALSIRPRRPPYNMKLFTKHLI